MDHFKRKYIYLFLDSFSLSYVRFIDDIFFAQTGSKDQLITFLNDLDTKLNSINFEYRVSQSSIPFLDAEVYIKSNQLYTKIYRKETGRQKILHINSEHPISLKNRIPNSQVFRVKCTCSTMKTSSFIAQNVNKNLLRKDTNMTFQINTFQQSKNQTGIKC